jgi:hypothetical protein
MDPCWCCASAGIRARGAGIRARGAGRSAPVREAKEEKGELAHAKAKGELAYAKAQVAFLFVINQNTNGGFLIWGEI